MDKRALALAFRDRLLLLMERNGLNQSRLADAAGIDRSALAQLLSGQAPRLPRAETLVGIAGSQSVSVDWLLGLDEAARLDTQVASTVAIEEAASGADNSQLAKWRREAAGTKIRYVPANLPDLLRLPETTAYEHALMHGPSPATRLAQSTYALDYSRRPETDMEACMPLQTIEALARGEGFWQSLPAATRHRQLAHMAALTEELYPTFRLYFYDNRRVTSVPLTIFGQMRAAIYTGDLYVVLTGGETVRRLSAHFDDLIRRASVASHDAAERLARYADGITRTTDECDGVARADTQRTATCEQEQ